MSRITDSRSLALFVISIAGLSACASTSKEKDGLMQADALVSRIENVHVEAELSMVKVHAALDSLHAIVAGDFEGESVDAYGDFVDAIERSEDQADELRDSAEPMRDAAEDVFEQWTANLEAFQSSDMRRVSERRLDETRERFDSVALSVERAQAVVDAFNLNLRDHALFLGHDFNSASIAAIEPEVERLSSDADEVDATLGACMKAARSYVAAAALPGGLSGKTPKVAKAGD